MSGSVVGFSDEEGAEVVEKKVCVAGYACDLGCNIGTVLSTGKACAGSGRCGDFDGAAEIAADFVFCSTLGLPELDINRVIIVAVGGYDWERE
jgi:hypothetical protein